jgi:hypothetical protein
MMTIVVRQNQDDMTRAIGACFSLGGQGRATIRHNYLSLHLNERGPDLAEEGSRQRE